MGMSVNIDLYICLCMRSSVSRFVYVYEQVCVYSGFCEYMFHIHIYIHVCECIFVQTSVYAHACICTCLGIYVCIQVFGFVSLCVCICLYIYICLCVCIFVTHMPVYVSRSLVCVCVWVCKCVWRWACGSCLLCVSWITKLKVPFHSPHLFGLHPGLLCIYGYMCMGAVGTGLAPEQDALTWMSLGQAPYFSYKQPWPTLVTEPNCVAQAKVKFSGQSGFWWRTWFGVIPANQASYPRAAGVGLPLDKSNYVTINC